MCYIYRWYVVSNGVGEGIGKGIGDGIGDGFGEGIRDSISDTFGDDFGVKSLNFHHIIIRPIFIQKYSASIASCYYNEAVRSLSPNSSSATMAASVMLLTMLSANASVMLSDTVGDRIGLPFLASVHIYNQVLCNH